MDVGRTSAVTEIQSECESLHPSSSSPLGHVRTVLTNSVYQPLPDRVKNITAQQEGNIMTNDTLLSL